MNNQVARKSKTIEVEREPTDLKILKYIYQPLTVRGPYLDPESKKQTVMGKICETSDWIFDIKELVLTF